MSDASRRKELQANYKNSHPEAGVYRLVNNQNNKALLGSVVNLGSLRGKLAFAQSTKMPGIFHPRVDADIRRFGIDAFSLDVLETFTPASEMTAAEIRDELALLEALWREKLDPALLY
ncbi:MAG TPA: GIY-YIG nuclease family protein [Thermomicrobiales bacterium]